MAQFLSLIAATNEVSQPLPFSQGDTVGVQNGAVEVVEPNNPMVLFQPERSQANSRCR